MSQYITTETGDWEIVIGMEVHAQITSQSKLFSGASAAFGAAPNCHVSLVDAGMPGMLPVINGVCVQQAVRTGLALNAQINLVSRFDRKNYFYPDLPTGYQISQYQMPIVGEGVVFLDMADGSVKEVAIERLHMEQDAGKSVHDQHPSMSYVDLNRAGVALMEIVTKPDMRSSEEAGAFLRKLRILLRYIETCDGNMDEGSMRADINVSVRRPGGPLGTRAEIKNVNSVRFLQQAIEYEARRQIQIIEDGGTIWQETRLFDAQRGETRSMRGKEDAHDYRYFPDPDLLPLVLTQDEVDQLKAALPELPDPKKARFIKEYGLSAYDASVLVAERTSADFFEEVARGRDGKIAANWVMGEYFGMLNKLGRTIENAPVSAKDLGLLVDRIMDGTLSGRLAKEVFEAMYQTGASADQIIEEKGLKQVSDTGEIEAKIDEVLAANPDKVAEYRAGKDKLFGFFVGQTMKATGGKANPSVVNEILKKKLAG